MPGAGLDPAEGARKCLRVDGLIWPHSRREADITRSVMNTMGMSEPVHVPVFPLEIVHWLDPQPGQILVDGTLGGGGHTRLIAERLAAEPGGGFVLALDRDGAAVANTGQRLSGLPVKLAQANFCDLPSILDELKIETVDAVLLDLGL